MEFPSHYSLHQSESWGSQSCEIRYSWAPRSLLPRDASRLPSIRRCQVAIAATHYCLPAYLRCTLHAPTCGVASSLWPAVCPRFPGIEESTLVGPDIYLNPDRSWYFLSPYWFETDEKVAESRYLLHCKRVAAHLGVECSAIILCIRDLPWTEYKSIVGLGWADCHAQIAGQHDNMLAIQIVSHYCDYETGTKIQIQHSSWWIFHSDFASTVQPRFVDQSTAWNQLLILDDVVCKVRHGHHLLRISSIATFTNIFTYYKIKYIHD